MNPKTDKFGKISLRQMYDEYVSNTDVLNDTTNMLFFCVRLPITSGQKGKLKFGKPIRAKILFSAFVMNIGFWIHQFGLGHDGLVFVLVALVIEVLIFLGQVLVASVLGIHDLLQFLFPVDFLV